jgi:hypothetical protein
MADTKISALTAVGTLALGDKVPIADADDLTATKSATFTQVKTLLQTANGLPRVKTVTGSDHSVTGTTGTEVTTLSQTLEAGTYTFKYTLLVQSNTTTTGQRFGINFTGTAATKVFMRYNVSTITTASNGLVEEESGAALVTGGVMNAWASKTYSTTAPNMVSAGVGAANADLLEIIEGLIIVTAQGDLELWHAAEIAATTTLVKVGSSLVVTRTV